MKISAAKIIIDFFYSFSGILLVNATLQLLLYPQWKSLLGADAFGQILFGISILSLFAISFGCAADNSRLILRQRTETSNGDFNLSLLLLIGFSVTVTFPIFLWGLPNENVWILELLLITTLLRYYSGVEFRLKINYRGYFFYHLMLSLGYIVGTFLFWRGAGWAISLLAGELAAFLFVLFFGGIYRPPFFCLQNFSVCFRSILQLSVAGVLNNTVLNLDRILLIFLIGAVANTQFYLISLLGKTLALITIPMNGIIIGYLTQKKTVISFRTYAKITAGTVGISAIFLWACVFFTPYFLDIFYPGTSGEVQGLIWVASLGQILCFSASILLTVLLTVASEKWLLGIQLFYAASFLVFTIAGGLMYGLSGFAYSVLLANVLRLGIALTIGVVKTGRLGV